MKDVFFVDVVVDFFFGILCEYKLGGDIYRERERKKKEKQGAAEEKNK